MDPSIPEMEQLKLRIEVLEEEKKNLQTINDDLNLELKYALFDAEATKRENSMLRRLLDEYKKGK